MPDDAPAPPPPPLRPLRTALALGLAAATSLGLARFSYALLLPPMRAALGWNYLTAGAMNTVNAAGYLAGALLAPRVFARLDARRAMLAGGAAAALLLAAHGAARGDALLYALRFLTGVASAVSFVGGGLLAARLAATPGAPAGLVLGLYYGGTGVGIIVSALVVPPLPWRGAWVLLGALAFRVELEIGDSPFESTASAKSAGEQAIRDNQSHYCPSPGLPVFREEAARFVRRREFRCASCS